MIHKIYPNESLSSGSFVNNMISEFITKKLFWNNFKYQLKIRIKSHLPWLSRLSFCWLNIKFALNFSPFLFPKYYGLYFCEDACQ